MANKKGYSRPGLFGDVVHYDENGKKVGVSSPSLLGGYNHYGEDGRKTGSSYPSFLGGSVHYDEKGNRAGDSYPSLLGGTNTYNAKGQKVHTSYPSLLGGVNTWQENPGDTVLFEGGAAEEYRKSHMAPPPGKSAPAAPRQPASRAEKALVYFWAVVVALLGLAAIVGLVYFMVK